MRIYGRKKFAFGGMCFLLGTSLVVMGFLKGFDIQKVILSISMLIIGISEMLRSTNEEAIKQEEIEKADERNRLLSLTAASKAFSVARNINFVLMLVFLIMGARWDDQPLIGVGLGFAFAFSVMIFSDLFFTAYYNRKM